MAPAGNRLRGEVEVVLGGERRTLRLTQGDLAALNERFDRGTWELLAALEAMDHRVLLGMLHRALHHGAPACKGQESEEDLGELEWVALEVADALGLCVWRSVTGKDPEEHLADNPELGKAAEEVGQGDPPLSTGERTGAGGSSSAPSSVSSRRSFGDSRRQSLPSLHELAGDAPSRTG